MTTPFWISFAALIVSALGLAATLFNIAWQHFIKVDSVFCTVVGGGTPVNPPHIFDFQLSWANVGTRAALVHHVGVRIYKSQDRITPHQMTTPELSNPLPHVLAPGQIYSLNYRARWTEQFESAMFPKQGTDMTASSTVAATELYFVLHTVVSNPKGKQYAVEAEIGTVVKEPGENGRRFGLSENRSFKLTKSNREMFGITA